MEVVGNPDDLIFIEGRLFQFEPADVDLDCFGTKESKIRIEIGVFVGDPFFRSVGQKLDEIGECFPGLASMTRLHHLFEGRIDELGSLLDEKFVLVKRDLVVDAEFVDKVQALVEIVGFIEVEKNKACLFAEVFVGDFIAGAVSVNFRQDLIQLTFTYLIEAMRQRELEENLIGLF